MTILAIDPSLRSTGYAVLETDGPQRIRALAYGNIKNKPDLLPSGCLLAIRERLSDMIAQHRPESCAVEGVIFVQSYKTAITMGAARGAAILAAAEKGLAIYEYSPRSVKQAVVGRGGAEKTQVAFMVRVLLGLTETPQADAADALAIGLTHLRAQASSLRAVNPLVRI
jgi:crossover junction endodeoxyribonuclease RuvC